MILPDEAVKEFIEIYKKEFGETLDTKVGREKAQRVFNFFKTITKTIAEKEDKNTEKNTKSGEK